MRRAYPACRPFPPVVNPPVTGEEQALDKSERDPHLRSVEEVSGYGIHAQDGEVGHVTDFIADDVAWRIRYMAVTTGILMFGRTVLLSPEWIEKISFDRKEVFVNLAEGLIKDAPEYKPTHRLPASSRNRCTGITTVGLLARGTASKLRSRGAALTPAVRGSVVGIPSDEASRLLVLRCCFSPGPDGCSRRTCAAL